MANVALVAILWFAASILIGIVIGRGARTLSRDDDALAAVERVLSQREEIATAAREQILVLTDGARTSDVDDAIEDEAVAPVAGA